MFGRVLVSCFQCCFGQQLEKDGKFGQKNKRIYINLVFVEINKNDHNIIKYGKVNRNIWLF